MGQHPDNKKNSATYARLGVKQFGTENQDEVKYEELQFATAIRKDGELFDRDHERLREAGSSG